MNIKSAGAIAFLLLIISCGTKLNSNLAGGDQLKPRDSALEVGELAPDFTLESHNNQKITLSSARGSKPTVLVFYRGNW